ncbi:hypothetical protein SAMN04488539_1030 [Corynebacterium timonense]|uniref:Uncharacterized protein n=1 Tax=Corynebacterium timonense TaxID=441500 RepID=A0A1H1PIK9_9CORY|nr:hypothetical protein SAMN04488539_1030 [Corynebacterium timonense]
MPGADGMPSGAPGGDGMPQMGGTPQQPPTN